MDAMKGDVCRGEKERDSRKDEKENSEKKPGMLRKAVAKIAVPLVAGIMAIGGGAACSSTVKSVYPTCDCCDADSEATDMENENDVNSDMDEEDSELDTPADVPETDADEDVTGDTVEEDAAADAVEDSEEDTASDVGEDVVEDTSADVSEEDVIGETVDVIGEDVIGDAPVDVAEEDVLSDTVTDTSADTGGEDVVSDLVDEDTSTDPVVEDALDEDATTTCDPVDTPTTTLRLATGNYTTIGNVTIRYNGPDTSGDGVYDIIVCGVLEATLMVTEGSSETAVLSDGTEVEIYVNTVRSWGSNFNVTIDAP